MSGFWKWVFERFIVPRVLAFWAPEDEACIDTLTDDCLIYADSVRVEWK